MSRRGTPPAVRASGRGFTLVEVLLAVAIATLVAVLLYSTFHTTTRVVTGHAERQQGRDATTRARDQLIRDLTCAAGAGISEPCPFQLTGPGDTALPFSDLSFCAMIPPPHDADLRWSELHHVQYRVTAEGNAGVLMRESAPIAGSLPLRPAQTTVVARAISRFTVLLFDGRSWLAAWPGPGKEAVPLAARLELQSHGEAEPFVTEIHIPAGNPITSTVIRASAETAP